MWQLFVSPGCDLLENMYLCGSNNNLVVVDCCPILVVICLKICTFVVATTTEYLNYQIYN